MARITQIENYVQTYKFNNAAQAKSVLQKTVGEKNWKIIEEHYVFGDVVQDMLDGMIVVEGSLIFDMSLDPKNNDHFYIKGFGQYHVHRKTTNDIIMSADYRIINQEPFSLSKLKEDPFLEIEVKRYYTRYFASGEPHFWHEVPLRFRLKIKTLEEGVHMLDYEQKHKVIIEEEEVGEIQFLPPYEHQIIDLRSLDRLRNDY